MVKFPIAYCEKCGRRLEDFTWKIRSYYLNTGEPAIQYLMKCPKARLWNFHSHGWFI